MISGRFVNYGDLEFGSSGKKHKGAVLWASFLKAIAPLSLADKMSPGTRPLTCSSFSTGPEPQRVRGPEYRGLRS